VDNNYIKVLHFNKNSPNGENVLKEAHLDSCRGNMCQFHQHSTSRYYVRRSLKRKNTVKLSAFFMLLGSSLAKTAHKTFMKLTPGRQNECYVDIGNKISHFGSVTYLFLFFILFKLFLPASVFRIQI